MLKYPCGESNLGVYVLVYGIVDVGSNTIRLSLYKYENNKIILLLNKKTMAGLAGYVSNGELSKEGIKTACNVLMGYKEIVENFKVDNIFVFATASLRNISNTDEAVTRIKEEVGFNVDIVLGEDEAIYDFIGATQALEVSDGILIDIGGGSTELVMYEDKKIVKAYSIPLGSLTMYSKYVSDLFPTEDERKAIKGEVLYHLNNLNGIESSEFACGVGGTIRATGKLFANMFKKKNGDKMLINCESIKKLFKKLDESEKNVLDKILKVIPDRVHTIIPGMIILETIVKYYGIKEIRVSPYGVREGYLFSKVLGGGDESNEEK